MNQSQYNQLFSFIWNSQFLWASQKEKTSLRWKNSVKFSTSLTASIGSTRKRPKHSSKNCLLVWKQTKLSSMRCSTATEKQQCNSSANL